MRVYNIVKKLSIVLLVITELFFFQVSKAQKKIGYSNGGNTVCLVVSGTGGSKEEATKNALRNAIEQAFGTFVSANTAVVNDDMVKDEIVTVTSGNIKSYDEINSRQIGGQDGNMYEVTVQTVVSIDDLVKFAQNHGMSAELAGQTFAMNIKIAQLNAKNENAALRHLIIQLYEIAKLGLYDFSLKIEEPTMEQGRAIVKVYIIPTPNANYNAYVNLAKKTLTSLSMSPADSRNALSSGTGAFFCGWQDNGFNEYLHRNDKDFFVKGKGVFKLRNNINDFHDSTDNEIYEIANGANFIYYYERFKYLSKFAFGIQDNIGHRIETRFNLDELPQGIDSFDGKRMRSWGNPKEYQKGYFEEKIFAHVVDLEFKSFRKSYDMLGGLDENSSCIFWLGYSLSEISGLSKIDVFPIQVNLLDNEILMEVLKGTATIKAMYEEAKKFVSYANKAKYKKKLRYLNMADDLLELIMKSPSNGIDKGDIQILRSQIKSEVNNIKIGR